MERSKLEQYFPLEQIAFPQEMTLIRVSPEEIHSMIRKLQEDHLTIQPVETPVERGDFVLLTAREEGEIRLINTVRPMGAAALADACLGQKIGAVVAEEYQIVGVRRRILPEFDESLVQSAGLPDVHTPELYRTYCLEVLRTRKTKKQTSLLARQVAEEWLAHCGFYLDEAELEATVTQLEGTVRSCMAETGYSGEEALEMLTQMLELPGDKISDLYIIGAYLMRRILLGQYCLKKYDVILGRDRYESALEKMVLEQGSQLEVCRQAYPYILFLHEKAMVQIDTEAKKYIKSRAPFSYE